MIFMIKAMFLVVMAGVSLINEEDYKHEMSWQETKNYFWTHVAPQVMSI